MTKKDKVMVALEMPPEIKQKLEEISTSREMSVSALIRFIIKEWLKNNDLQL